MLDTERLDRLMNRVVTNLSHYRCVVYFIVQLCNSSIESGGDLVTLLACVPLVYAESIPLQTRPYLDRCFIRLGFAYRVKLLNFVSRLHEPIRDLALGDSCPTCD